MEIQNLINLLYNNNQIINDDIISRLSVGDILKARVLSIAGNIITLQINNKITVEARDVSSVNYNVGDEVEFIVNDKVDDKLVLKSNIFKTSTIEDKLMQMGIEFNEKNKELIDVLYKNQIPITKENIEIIRTTKKYYRKLSELIKNNNLILNSDIKNDDIRELLKNIIKDNDNNSIHKLNQPNEETKKTNDMEINRNLVKIDNDNIFTKDFLNANDSISFEKLVFMLKNNLNFNAKNIVLLNNILFGQKTVTNQIHDLIKVIEEDIIIDLNSLQDKNKIEKNIKNEILDSLRKFDIDNIKDKEKLNTVMKELLERIENIKNNAWGKEINNVINKHIEEIKSSLDFINKLNDNMTFIQVPIYMNDSLRNLDIYIKKDSKGNKNYRNENTKIFISLNTNNLDTVQVLIEVNKKDINLNFKINNEKIRKKIKSNEKILSNNIKKHGFNNIIFNYNICDEKITVLKTENNNHIAELNTFDIRV